MVQDIEGVCAELKTEPVRNSEPSSDREVQLREAKSWNIVPPFRSLTGRGLNGERRGIQYLAAGSAVALDPKGLPGHKVRTDRGEATRIRGDTEYRCVKGKTASSDDHSIGRPIASHKRQGARPGGRGDGVSKCSRETLTDIKV